MKFKITLKDPDGVFQGIDDAAMAGINLNKVTPEERDLLWRHRQKTLDAFVDTWVEHGEYITLEFDTEAKTVRVVPKSELN